MLRFLSLKLICKANNGSEWIKALYRYLFTLFILFFSTVIFKSEMKCDASTFLKLFLSLLSLVIADLLLRFSKLIYFFLLPRSFNFRDASCFCFLLAKEKIHFWMCRSCIFAVFCWDILLFSLSTVISSVSGY